MRTKYYYLVTTQNDIVIIFFAISIFSACLLYLVSHVWKLGAHKMFFFSIYLNKKKNIYFSCQPNDLPSRKKRSHARVFTRTQNVGWRGRGLVALRYPKNTSLKNVSISFISRYFIYIFGVQNKNS